MFRKIQNKNKVFLETFSHNNGVKLTQKEYFLKKFHLQKLFQPQLM